MRGAARVRQTLRTGIDAAVYVAVRTLRCAAEILPLDTCESVACALATFLTYVVPIRRKTVDENLRRVLPHATVAERRQLTWEMWRHLLLMACEIVQAQRKVHDTNWREHVRNPRKETLVRGLLDERPRLIVSGHFGNFEFASLFLGVMGFRSYAIARDLDNPFLHRYVTQVREAKGQFILSKDGSAAIVDGLLQRGELLALLGDQSAGPKGCWVDFLGQPSSCHKALAVFTLSGGAPMMVSGTRRLGKPLQFSIDLEDVADPAALPEGVRGVRELTAWYNDRLSRMILRCPGQYWWLHKRWKFAPPAKYVSTSKSAVEEAKRSAA